MHLNYLSELNQSKSSFISLSAQANVVLNGAKIEFRHFTHSTRGNCKGRGVCGVCWGWAGGGRCTCGDVGGGWLGEADGLLTGEAPTGPSLVY